MMALIWCWFVKEQQPHNIVCDGCGYWMHTRCNGIRDEEQEPRGFVCAGCVQKQQQQQQTVAVAAGSKRGRQ
uniref:PHD-type domain-containing protein n=1 Tax=Tetradesmus obliquus TaxID=3088 RepID=A0A383W5E5_TETOB|eukprot:jgi/Sobl393_1/10288/SZX72855.1